MLLGKSVAVSGCGMMQVPACERTFAKHFSVSHLSLMLTETSAHHEVLSSFCSHVAKSLLKPVHACAVTYALKPILCCIRA